MWLRLIKKICSLDVNWRGELELSTANGTCGKICSFAFVLFGIKHGRGRVPDADVMNNSLRSRTLGLFGPEVIQSPVHQLAVCRHFRPQPALETSPEKALKRSTLNMRPNEVESRVAGTRKIDPID